MSGKYSCRPDGVSENGGIGDFSNNENPLGISGRLQSKPPSLKMTISDKELANLFDNNRRDLSADWGKHKILVNKKQKHCEEEEDDDDEAIESAEIFKYSSTSDNNICLTNPFLEKNSVEHGRVGEERSGVRLLCDNNRNRKDSFATISSQWAVPQGATDVNENFMKPVIHHKLRMSYVEQSTRTNHNNNINNGCSTGGFATAHTGTAFGCGDDAGKAKRPQSISMGASAFNRDQFKGFSNGARQSVANGRILDANLAAMGFSVFKVGLDDDNHNQSGTPLRGAPLVPQRRSQSTPRPAHNGRNISSHSSLTATTANTALHSGEAAKKKSENRPKSLDRGVTYLENVTMKSSVNFNLMHSTTYNQFAQTPTTKEMKPSKSLGPGAGMKSSASFHGQCYVPTDGSVKDLGKGRITHGTTARPLSYTGGSTTEQAFLENQLRVYSEQLKTITESVRKYSEKAKFLSELKRQELNKNNSKNNKMSNGYSLPTSKSDSKISALALQTNSQLNESHKQTSSHQLRLFLEDIRSNIRDSSVNNNLNVLDKATLPQPTVPFEAENDYSPTHYSQHQMTEKILIPEQQPPPIPERKRLALLNDKATTALSSGGCCLESKQDFKTGSSLLNSTGSTKLRSNEMDFNQILDNFNIATKRSTMREDDYHEDYLTAMQRTSEEIRQAALSINRSNSGHQDLTGGSSDENSSSSTTPGSIREAVQNLLAMPRNGVQVMDDRMRLFIDILDTQGKFSQVHLLVLMIPINLVKFDQTQLNLI